MADFDQLLSAIKQTHTLLQAQAVNAVNQRLTIRNWLIGFYIVEFEQQGEDRAKYGERLIESITTELKHIKGIDRRSLFRFRSFYLAYPYIIEYLKGSDIFRDLSVGGGFYPVLKVGTPSPLLGNIKELLPAHRVPPEKVVTRLSYSHIEHLLEIEDPLKRSFYELEAIKGIWSVRELKRQINSLFYERSGLSTKPEKLSEADIGQLNTYLNCGNGSKPVCTTVSDPIAKYC